MKSAEEWAGEIPSFWLKGEQAEYFRKVQADALRHAAESCRIMASMHSNPDLADCHIHSAERIEAEALKLEQQ